jgi:hypothetical protein
MLCVKEGVEVLILWVLHLVLSSEMEGCDILVA